MARFFKDNGLTIVLMALFAASILGQWLTGWRFENEELARHGEAGVTSPNMRPTRISSPPCSRTGRASSSRCRPMSC